MASMKRTNQLGIQKIVSETDCIMIKEAIEGDGFRLAQYGELIFEVKSLICSSFSSFYMKKKSYSSFSVKLSPREYNKVAHALASKGCNYPINTNLVWDDTPDELQAVMSL